MHFTQTTYKLFLQIKNICVIYYFFCTFAKSLFNFNSKKMRTKIAKLESIAKKKGNIKLSFFWQEINNMDNKTLKEGRGNGELSLFHTYLLDNFDRNLLGEEENKIIRSLIWDVENLI